MLSTLITILYVIFQFNLNRLIQMLLLLNSIKNQCNIKYTCDKHENMEFELTLNVRNKR